MLFTSYEFLAFLCVIFVLYYLIPKKYQWMLLLAGSYFFYACAGIHFLAYIAVTTLTTWLAAKQITAKAAARDEYLAEHKADLDREGRRAYRAEVKKGQRLWFLCGLLLNLGILAVVKYADFVIDNINKLTHGEISFLGIALPMGISFYTFKSLGYLIDVYREKYPCQDSLGKYALFVSFFPQIVQGPISRYDKLSETLFEEHAYEPAKIQRGLMRVLWGFFKKLLVADRLVTAVKTLAGTPEDYRGAYVVLLIFLYAVELYADFTGGIDITIGIGEMLGIGMEENFNTPYFSKNINEYWTRWHITMGAWFKDYIFYPISVSKGMMKLSKWSREKMGRGVGKRVPVYLANIIVWFATGLWHGAAWNFIVWGLLNCFVTLVSYEMEPLYEKFHSRFGWSNNAVYDVWQMFRTFWIMGAIRILDVYRNVPISFRQLGTIFTTGGYGQMFADGLGKFGLNGPDIAVVAVGIVLMIAVSIVKYTRKTDVRDLILARPAVLKCALMIVLFLSIVIFGAYGVGYDANQFIYNQF